MLLKTIKDFVEKNEALNLYILYLNDGQMNMLSNSINEDDNVVLKRNDCYSGCIIFEKSPFKGYINFIIDDDIVTPVFEKYNYIDYFTKFNEECINDIRNSKIFESLKK